MEQDRLVVFQNLLSFLMEVQREEKIFGSEYKLLRLRPYWQANSWSGNPALTTVWKPVSLL